MGLGNGNPKQGNKGSNFNYELRHLQLLGILNNSISGLAPPGGLATEATLQSVLTAVDSMRDYEVRLVVDSDTPPVTWLEVRYWDAQTGALGAPQYYLPGSTTPGTPTGSISYINPNTFLASILAELVALNTVDFATETSLSAIDTKLTGALKTITTTQATVNGSTSAGIKSVSLFFRGTGGTLDGMPVPNNYTANLAVTKPEDTLPAIPYTVPTSGAAEVLIIEMA